MNYRIREERKRVGLSQEELSIKSGISRATISALENDHKDVVKLQTLCKIADALNVRVDRLFST